MDYLTTHTSLSPIRRGFAPGFVNYKKGALDSQPQVYQLLDHGRWFSPVTPAFSTTETGRHDIAEILLKVALSTINQIKSIKSNYIHVLYLIPHTILTRRSRFFFFLNGVKNNYQSFLKSHTCAFVIITRPF